jgi:anti-sigma factor RsiW
MAALSRRQRWRRNGLEASARSLGGALLAALIVVWLALAALLGRMTHGDERRAALRSKGVYEWAGGEAVRQE